jgi:hypothetical protein
MITWPDIAFGPINLWSMPKVSNQEPQSDDLYEKLIYQNDDKFYQLRLVVNEFKGKNYVHIRKYFQTYESDYQASREGVSMEASLDNVFSLLDGLMEIVSKEESRYLVLKHFSEFMEATKN